jgi:hypothetical protein
MFPDTESSFGDPQSIGNLDTPRGCVAGIDRSSGVPNTVCAIASPKAIAIPCKISLDRVASCRINKPARN